MVSWTSVKSLRSWWFAGKPPQQLHYNLQVCVCVCARQGIRRTASCKCKNTKHLLQLKGVSFLLHFPLFAVSDLTILLTPIKNWTAWKLLDWLWPPQQVTWDRCPASKVHIQTTIYSLCELSCALTHTWKTRCGLHMICITCISLWWDCASGRVVQQRLDLHHSRNIWLVCSWEQYSTLPSELCFFSSF